MAIFRNVAGASVALLVVLAMVFEARAAQCPDAMSMIACQAAVTKPNVTPTLACCDKVKSVIQGANGAECLCRAMTSPTAVAFNVMKDEALKLPGKCHELMGLQYIKGYNCAGSTVP